MTYAAIKTVEKALGKPLPFGAEVHHVDGNPLNNKHSNLVACENQAYHKLLHRRADALKACGHVDWRACNFCKVYSNPSDLKTYRHPGEDCENVYHPACRAEYDYKRRHRRRF